MNLYYTNQLKSNPQTLNQTTFQIIFNPIFFSSITTTKNSQSPQVKCLIVQSILNRFPVHQPAAFNSMHLQSTYTPHLQHLSNQRSISNHVEYQWRSFFAEIVTVLRLLGILSEELYRGSSAIF